jgi:hypothetical protein
VASHCYLQQQRGPGGGGVHVKGHLYAQQQAQLQGQRQGAGVPGQVGQGVEVPVVNE